MEDLSKSISKMRKKYREIFRTTVDAIKQRVDEIKPKTLDGDIFDTFEKNSDGEKWQTAVLDMFENDISHEIVRKWKEILAYREKFSCKGCATCCNLACSEFAPDELSQRAQLGDKFASQFTSVFIPYESTKQAEKIYPEYIQLLKDNVKEDVYFYHCPKLNECNRCLDYENRPQICRDFPDNPLSILPESCGFYEWRLQVEPVALMLHAMMEIIDYYKQKIPVLEARKARRQEGRP